MNRLQNYIHPSCDKLWGNIFISNFRPKCQLLYKVLLLSDQHNLGLKELHTILGCMGCESCSKSLHYTHLEARMLLNIKVEFWGACKCSGRKYMSTYKSAVFGLVVKTGLCSRPLTQNSPLSLALLPFLEHANETAQEKQPVQLLEDKRWHCFSCDNLKSLHHWTSNLFQIYYNRF